MRSNCWWPAYEPGVHEEARLHLTRAPSVFSPWIVILGMFRGRAAPVAEGGRSRAGETHIRWAVRIL